MKPIRACLCLWSQRPSLLWCSPAGVLQRTARLRYVLETVHDVFGGYLVCGGIAFYPHTRPGAEGGPTSSSGLRVKGCQLLPCLLSCCCWRRRPPAVRRSRLRAAPPPDAFPPELPWCRPVVAARRVCQWRRGAWLPPQQHERQQVSARLGDPYARAEEASFFGSCWLVEMPYADPAGVAAGKVLWGSNPLKQPPSLVQVGPRVKPAMPGK